MLLWDGRKSSQVRKEREALEDLNREVHFQIPLQLLGYREAEAPLRKQESG